MSWRGTAKRQKSCDLGHQRHRGDQLHAAQRLQRLHHRRQRQLAQRVAQRLLQPLRCAPPPR